MKRAILLFMVALLAGCPEAPQLDSKLVVEVTSEDPGEDRGLHLVVLSWSEPSPKSVSFLVADRGDPATDGMVLELLYDGEEPVVRKVAFAAYTESGRLVAKKIEELEVSTSAVVRVTLDVLAPECDADGDGVALAGCLDGDEVVFGADADDEKPHVYPGAEEICDGLDNDQNGEVDEGFDDTDGDQEADCVDNDWDGDKKSNDLDNCPKVANFDQVDTDTDGEGDACDTDDDGDGKIDDVDNCKLVANPDQEDQDEDGLGDACDGDLDGDKIDDGSDNCPGISNEDQVDTDGDEAGDACDDDDDGDGVDDPDDCDPKDATIFPGATEQCNNKDDDCDQVVDGFMAPADKQDGVCAGAEKECVEGAWLLVNYQAIAGYEADEISCDDTDNDCDGETDEDHKQGGSKTYVGPGGNVEGLVLDDGCGLGDCAGGKVVCAHDEISLTCSTLAKASLEICDGDDDDCDGEVDEDFPEIGKSCDGGDSDQCENGTWTCKPDSSGTYCPEAIKDIVEICDGVDNDCDNDVDEGFDIGGSCDGPDQDECANGSWTCKLNHSGAECVNESVINVQEVCDGADNDCDGVVDEEIDVDDGISCTLDVCYSKCLPSSDSCCGLCGTFDVSAPCQCDASCIIFGDCCADMANFCTEDGVTAAGVIHLPDDGQCDDLVACTTDTCDVDLGCVHVLVDWCICESDDDCLEGAECLEGECVGGVLGCQANSDCDNGEPCTAHFCAEDGTCEHTLYSCDDGDPCTTDSCTGNFACTNVLGLCEDDDGDGWAEEDGDCDDNDDAIFPGAPEICDSEDNDCDNAVDEGFDLGGSCDGPDQDDCANGTWTCNANGSGTECVNESVINIQEVCDGADNDCDGDVDEGLPECVGGW